MTAKEEDKLDKLNVEDLKKIELNILLDVAAFCDNHGIRYTLQYGTLLGAVRHKGFIPWDDDIDIGMPRDDYERFIREYKSERYKLLEQSIDKAYPYAFGKVIDINTVIYEPAQYDYPMGLYIDILPIDGLPMDEKKRVKHLKRANRLAHMAIIKLISPDFPSNMKQKILRVGAKTLMLPISYRRIVSWQVAHAKKFEFDTSDYVSVLTVRHVSSLGMQKRSYYTNLTEVEFEGQLFKAPEAYDDYLTAIFKDYMKLPPEEKRVSNHMFEAYIK